jgi:hypothetical protein
MQKKFLLILLCLTIAPLVVKAADRFEFSGLGLDLQPGEIRALFPNSQSYDPNERSFYVHLSPRDYKNNHIYFLHVHFTGSITNRLRLSFEAPSKPRAKASFAEFEARHPNCIAIRQTLVSRFGKRAKVVQFFEEALEHTGYIWRSGDRFMRLECGRYYQRSRFFAMDLVFGYVKDNCDIQLYERCYE